MWGQVLGLISLERFGHLVGAVDDSDAWFDHALVLAAGIVGLRVSASPPVGRSRRPRKDAGTRG